MSEISETAKSISEVFVGHDRDCKVECGYRESLQRAIQDAIDAEREECAKLADAHFIYGHSVAGPGYAAILAAKIRARGAQEKP